MAYKASLFLAFFLLVSTSLARQQQHQQQQQQQQQLRNVCQLRNIDALEPNYVVQAEAGLTEFWDANNQQFQCAGVDFIRHRIQPGGLLLPSYVNTPILAFVEKGKAVQGVILPGCPETFEISQQQQFSSQGQRQGQQQGQRFDQQDRHQKVENLYPGDVVAVPTGAAHWLYNDGDNELVVVVFFDAQNSDNQLDPNHRRFFLAGNPQDQSQQFQGRQHTREQQQRPSRQQQSQQQNAGNIFRGFDTEFIAEAFNVDQETAQKLQGERDQRGHIVNVQQGQLQIIRPQQEQQPWGQQQQQPWGQQPQYPWGQQRGQGQQPQYPWGRQQQGGSGRNGLEETICSLKVKENIDNPTHADFVNPQAGRISNLNNFKFPILQLLQLSVERGELYPNAIQAPHYTFNAHNLVYVTDGTLRVQIVNHEGNSVFDDELNQGQVVVIPQNFAVIKRAGQQGARWVSFRTNENAMISNLAGRLSAIRSMPVGVVANSYQISVQEAQRLKYNQPETVLLTPGYSREQIQKAEA
uniref:11S globulin seed storage protein G3-like n=1 Tax=Erigeron canadensis TaxID=72917 RepID=UPI001CB97884|nr:11S globulin seed storage protein G3-like [Erigeron canadensis]